MLKISDISEFHLIKRLESVLLAHAVSNPGSLVNTSIGDDAAVISATDAIQVVTTDTMVENVHFRNETTTMIELGWKAIAVNYSDIAAMGCEPIYSVVSLGLRPDQLVESIEDMYRGFCEIVNRHGGEIVGGDIVRSDTFFISVTVVGQSKSGHILKRNSAKVGDLIGITGHLGCSRAGLSALQKPLAVDEETKKHLIGSHNMPNPKLNEGVKLADYGIKTAMDISDGLINDLTKICEASSVGASIKSDTLPIDKYLKLAFPERYLEFATSGGEDYELLFTGPPDIMEAINDQAIINMKLVGSIIEGPSKVSIVDSKGNDLPTSTGGWDHFKENRDN